MRDIEGCKVPGPDQRSGISDPPVRLHAESHIPMGSYELWRTSTTCLVDLSGDLARNVTLIPEVHLRRADLDDFTKYK